MSSTLETRQVGCTTIITIVNITIINMITITIITTNTIITMTTIINIPTINIINIIIIIIIMTTQLQTVCVSPEQVSQVEQGPIVLRVDVQSLTIVKLRLL